MKKNENKYRTTFAKAKTTNKNPIKWMKMRGCACLMDRCIHIHTNIKQTRQKKRKEPQEQSQHKYSLFNAIAYVVEESNKIE